ncbi:MAG: TldD/PmbA family protein [Erysipelotrichaceae bacterium]|nr:TldD/PmbA family protein [Erysipelotrichaceae bacterium]
MKYDYFFKLAKEKGIEECELKIYETYSLSFSLFHSEMDDYQVNDGYSIIARGLINGKFGSASCDVWNKDKAEFLVSEIVKNASVIEDDDPMFIYKGDAKYKKINTYNKELMDIPANKKIEKLYELEKLIKEGEKITEVAGVSYSETRTTSTLLNSHGLKLSQKNNYFFIMGEAVAKEGDQVKTGYDFLFSNDFNQVNPKELADKIIEETTSQLGGEPCASGDYQVVLDNSCVASLLGAYLSSVDAEEVQKHTSLFEGKLNTKIASNKLTIEDRPLQKTLFGRGFDDEGVATYNKPIIKNGVLMTYLYNLTTAAKDGVKSTGNGFGGAKIGTSPVFVYMKPGKKSLEELFQEVNNGVYITDIQGLHAGLDPQTGNFSLQSTGFLIKDGKKDRPLDIITVSGNLMKLFNDIKTIGNDSKTFISAVSCPSIVIKKLSIGGK